MFQSLIEKTIELRCRRRRAVCHRQPVNVTIAVRRPAEVARDDSVDIRRSRTVLVLREFLLTDGGRDIEHAPGAPPIAGGGQEQPEEVPMPHFIRIAFHGEARVLDGPSKIKRWAGAREGKRGVVVGRRAGVCLHRFCHESQRVSEPFAS